MCTEEMRHLHTAAHVVLRGRHGDGVARNVQAVLRALRGDVGEVRADVDRRLVAAHAHRAC